MSLKTEEGEDFWSRLQRSQCFKGQMRSGSSKTYNKITPLQLTISHSANRFDPNRLCVIMVYD